MHPPLDPRIARALARARARKTEALAQWALVAGAAEELGLEDLPSLATELDGHLESRRWHEACAISETLSELADGHIEAEPWVAYAEEAQEAARTALAVEGDSTP